MIAEQAPDSCPFCGAGITANHTTFISFQCGNCWQSQWPDFTGNQTAKCLRAERERLTRERDEAKAERDRLRDWKESAMAVEREWNANAIATALGGQPGESQRAVIAREVPKLLARVKRLEEEVGRLRNYLRIAVGPDAHGW